MANLNYFIINAPMKQVAESFSNPDGVFPEMEEVNLTALHSDTFGEGDSVVTLCDNFITIYGYKTWKKKFVR